MQGHNHLTQGTCTIQSCRGIRGRIRVPGDKSISHRAVMLASIAEGLSVIRGFLESEDCTATVHAFEQLGVEFVREEGSLGVRGHGLDGFSEPENILDMGNSGTGARLLMGVLAGQDFVSILTGDSSLRSRPMARITKPLSQMGARFMGRQSHNKLPIAVQGGSLQGIEYTTPVASAQIKSAILLAGLFADGWTVIEEPGPSRDHTERMLQTFGCPLETNDNVCSLEGGKVLKGQEVFVPGDISSAAFFIVAALLVPDSDLVIESVGINPTRTGLLDVLKEMGASITYENERVAGAEPVVDIRVQSSLLTGVQVQGDTVVRMIDEFPIFAVAAACATSPSEVCQANELRMKESDRISTVVRMLQSLGAKVEEREDGFLVQGNAKLTGTTCQSMGDHRIAMAAAIAGLVAKDTTSIQGTGAVTTSFPTFFLLLQTICPDAIVERT